MNAQRWRKPTHALKLYLDLYWQCIYVLPQEEAMHTRTKQYIRDRHPWLMAAADLAASLFVGVIFAIALLGTP